MLSINISVNAAKHCILDYCHLHTRTVFRISNSQHMGVLTLKAEKLSYTLHFQAFYVTPTKLVRISFDDFSVLSIYM